MMFDFYTCETCRAFAPQVDNSQEFDSDADGVCKLNPPIVIAIGDEGAFGTLYPCVNREDWCCQWVGRDGAIDG